MAKLEFHSIDRGFCRVYYTCRNDKNEKILYCFMKDEMSKTSIYKCSEDGEPEFRVFIKNKIQIQMIPTQAICDDLHNDVNELIVEHKDKFEIVR